MTHIALSNSLIVCSFLHKILFSAWIFLSFLPVIRYAVFMVHILNWKNTKFFQLCGCQPCSSMDVDVDVKVYSHCEHSLELLVLNFFPRRLNVDFFSNIFNSLTMKRKIVRVSVTGLLVKISCSYEQQWNLWGEKTKLKMQAEELSRTTNERERARKQWF